MSSTRDPDNGRWGTTHGHYVGNKPSPTYRVWDSTHGRCYREGNASYPTYGAVGVTVCARWHTFENFLEDMGIRPKGLQLDRIDGRKGYCPENCRWITRKEQARNRKSNLILRYEGEEKTAVEWAEDLDLTYGTLIKRINRGWSTDRALSTPIQIKGLKS